MNYSVLFPAFSETFESSSEGLSAFFWILLYAGFIISIGMAISNYFMINKNIGFLTNFFKNLDADLSNWKDCYDRYITPHSNFAARNQLREFRRALNAYDQVYYSPAPAKYFFGVDTIASSYFQNRVIDATPGLLVGFGLVGTFTGLQIALGSIELSDTSAILSQIGHLISGASLAFLTSVWGTLFSLLYNLMDKVITSKILKELDHLSIQVEKKFTLSTPEQFLVKLLNATHSNQLDTDHLASAINDSQLKNMDLMQGMMNNFAVNIAETLGSEMRSGTEPAASPKRPKLRSRNSRMSDNLAMDHEEDHQPTKTSKRLSQKKEAM